MESPQKRQRITHQDKMELVYLEMKPEERGYSSFTLANQPKSLKRLRTPISCFPTVQSREILGKASKVDSLVAKTIYPKIRVSQLFDIRTGIYIEIKQFI